LIDSVVGGRVFDTLERKFARTFPRRILRVFSTVIKFGLTSASIAGSISYKLFYRAYITHNTDYDSKYYCRIGFYVRLYHSMARYTVHCMHDTLQ
jgi:hypothetical protein